MLKIRRGDQVMVRAGKDKGKVGVVKRVLVSKGLAKSAGYQVIVQGANLVKKHVKAKPDQPNSGGIIAKEAPIHVSNVAIINPKTKKIDKVKVKQLEDGKRVRVYGSDAEVIDG